MNDTDQLVVPQLDKALAVDLRYALLTKARSKVHAGRVMKALECAATRHAATRWWNRLESSGGGIEDLAEALLKPPPALCRYFRLVKQRGAVNAPSSRAVSNGEAEVAKLIASSASSGYAERVLDVGLFKDAVAALRTTHVRLEVGYLFGTIRRNKLLAALTRASRFVVDPVELRKHHADGLVVRLSWKRSWKDGGGSGGLILLTEDRPDTTDTVSTISFPVDTIAPATEAPALDVDVPAAPVEVPTFDVDAMAVEVREQLGELPSSFFREHVAEWPGTDRTRPSEQFVEQWPTIESTRAYVEWAEARAETTQGASGDAQNDDWSVDATDARAEAKDAPRSKPARGNGRWAMFQGYRALGEALIPFLRDPQSRKALELAIGVEAVQAALSGLAQVDGGRAREKVPQKCAA